jgi:serine/threonine protein phosphatase 1
MWFCRYALNTEGNDYFTTDNHGCWRELLAFLKSVNFNPEKDRLFHGGDMIDRGPDSTEVLRWLAKPWFYPIMANHELTAIGISRGYHQHATFIKNGGQWFLNLPQALQIEFASAFMTLPLGMQVETPFGAIGIVHAEPLPSWKDTAAQLEGFAQLSKTKRDDLVSIITRSRTRWEDKIATDITSIDRVYVGHSPYLEPVRFGNVFNFDTGVVYGNKLTIVNMTKDTLHYVPAEKVYWESSDPNHTPAANYERFIR